MSMRGNFALNKVPISKILIFRRKSDPSYSFIIIIIIYFLEVERFFFLVEALDSWFWGEGEDRTTSTVVSYLLAAEAKTFLNANLSFLWSELPNIYGIYIHSIWILGLPSGGRGEIRAYGRRGGFVFFGLLQHNLVGLVPLGLESFSFGIPFVNGGGYGVHGVDVVHEYWVESFNEEGDKDSLVNYPTEVGSNFEFIDIGEDFVLGLDNELEAGKGFCLEVGSEKCFCKGVFEVGKGSKFLVVNGIGGEGCCLF